MSASSGQANVNCIQPNVAEASSTQSGIAEGFAGFVIASNIVIGKDDIPSTAEDGTFLSFSSILLHQEKQYNVSFQPNDPWVNR